MIGEGLRQNCGKKLQPTQPGKMVKMPMGKSSMPQEKKKQCIAKEENGRNQGG